MNSALRDAAVEAFASRSHNTWRRDWLKANPQERGKPRMRLREGEMVDINQPWGRLHPKAKADNKVAAYDAFDALEKFPDSREAAADYVHKRWMQRNKADANQPRDLFKPYRSLPEVEKDKDRAHVDLMASILATRGRPAKGAATKARRSGTAKAGKAKAPARRAKAGAGAQAGVSVRINAEQWRRLERVARQLSRAAGRKVTPEALGLASLEAMLATFDALGQGRKKSEV